MVQFCENINEIGKLIKILNLNILCYLFSGCWCPKALETYIYMDIVDFELFVYNFKHNTENVYLV